MLLGMPTFILQVRTVRKGKAHSVIQALFIIMSLNRMKKRQSTVLVVCG